VNRFGVITELVYVEAMKGTAYHEDLYEKLLTALEQHKHTQNTLIIMTRARIHQILEASQQL
jgi:hypothetical protein